MSIGMSIILISGPPFVGVLHALSAGLTQDFHNRLMHDPLSAPRTWFERRHISRKCTDCSFIAEMVVTQKM